MARYVDNFFKLSDSTKLHIKSLDSPFPTAVGEIVYYRTYSRRKKDGSQEHWADTVIRVTEGILSVRKDYYLKHNLGWNDEEWQQFGSEFAEYMFNMKFLPPGRGLWAMGTEYMYERGSAALNNCGACTCKDLILGATWTMDMLMCGVGVGAAVDWEGEVVIPDKSRYVHHVIADSREGWVNSLKHLLQAYIPDSEGKTLKFPKFDYSKVRKKGASIRGFGGTASGPGPLQDLHFRVEWFLDTYIKYKDTHSPDCVADLFEAFYEKGFYLGMPPGDSSRERFEKQHKQIKYSRKIKYDKTRCCADIINSIGVCVVAGNVRRSAEILLGDPDDDTFLNLKNNERDPSRQDICWMSNNSVRLDQTWQFSEFIPAIAERIRNNGEPGVINLKNIQRYGRFGREAGSKGIIEDQATVSNPCVTGDTLIMTSDGLVPASDLVGKEFTAVVNGKEYRSTSDGFWSTGVKQTYKVSLSNGLDITVTDNHRLLNANNQWKTINSLTVGDSLSIQNNNAYEWNGGEGSYEEGYFIGQLIGDGTLEVNSDGKAQPQICIWVPTGTDILDYAPARIIYEYAKSLNPGPCFNGYVKQTSNSEKYDKYRIRIVAFIDVAEKYNVEPLEKKVYEQGSYQFSKGLISGFFDADGSVQDASGSRKSVRLAQSDLDRLKSVQRLLLAMGINSNIYTDRRKAGQRMMPDGKGGSKLYNHKAQHELVISKRDIITFRDIIGFQDTEKKNKLDKMISSYNRGPYSSKFLSEITAIEPQGAAEVYDCTIPDAHMYVGNGFVNHNCGEIPLEPYELCNLSECFPSRCFKQRDPNSGPLDEDDEYFDEDEFMKALEFATFYTSTVSLLPTQWEVTNKVIARNRRIGVSLSGIADVYDRIGQTHLTRLLRTGYSHVRSINEKLAQDSGVRSSIRVTTVKPSGSISQLAGVSSGMHFPTFKYAIRRIMVSETSPICKVLVENNVPYEKSVYTPGTLVFSFPIDQGKTRAATDVSMWEQFALLATLQREWSDNMVSCTIYFQPETEGSHIEHALAQFIPLIKSVSMLPHTENGVYAQAPYEGIDRDKYIDLNSSIKRVDWSNYGGSDGEMPKYCTNGVCEVPAE